MYRDRLITQLRRLVDRIGSQRIKQGKYSTRDLDEMAKLAKLAIEHSTEMTRHSPWNAAGYLHLGMAQDRAADILAHRPPPVDAASIKSLRQAGMDNIRKSVVVNPYNIRTRVSLTAHCIKHHQWDSLQAIAGETVRLWPHYGQMPRLAHRATQVLIKLKKPARAEKLLLALEPHVHATQLGPILAARAQVHLARGEWDALREIAVNEVRRQPQQPTMPRLVNQGAQVLIKIKKPDEAEKLLLAVQPLVGAKQLGIVLDGRARVFMARRDWPNMLKTAKAMLAAKPPPRNARHCLATAYYELGQFNKAKAECQRLLLANPKDKHAASLLKAIRSRSGKPKTK